MGQGIAKTLGSRKQAAAGRPVLGLCVLACLILASSAFEANAQGRLSAIRDDVRSPSSSSSSKSTSSDHDDDSCDCFGECDCDEPGVFDELFGAIFMRTITMPFWGPPALARDSYTSTAYFPRFPYHRRPGYMMSAPWPSGLGVPPGPVFGKDALLDSPPIESWLTRPRRWGARIRFDHGDNFDGLERIAGHLLLSTSSRFGLDTETSYLRESFPGGGEDRLWLGDCNVVFRIAQSERMQWRAGLGFNWLDDPVQTDFGFNFTYGADFFPHKPWVLSATLDWGTLRRAELFRFRSTVGVLVLGMEAYTGYEYLDIDSVQINSLIAGVRIWF